MSQPDAKLDAIFTTDEVAERLRTTRRYVFKVARNIGACSIFGREYRFSEQDVLDIWHAMRVSPVRPKNPALDILAGSALERLRERALKKNAERRARQEEKRLQRAARMLSTKPKRNADDA